jgi:hypothetical protein
MEGWAQRRSGNFGGAKFRDDKMGSALVGIFRWREIPG